MEDVGTVFMNENARIIVIIVGIAADVIATVHDQYPGVQLRGQPFR